MSNIRALVLTGTKYEMGIEYGKQLLLEMNATLEILTNFFTHQHGVSFEKLAAKADIFYQRYPASYQKFIEGVAEGSGLSLDEVKILNGMETLSSLVNAKITEEVRSDVAGCSFLSVPHGKTISGSNIIGRNYDFPSPYDQTAKYLTVTVLKEEGMVPTAFISMPGQIYCPTCINANSLFIELNNGMPSGGSEVNFARQSTLISLLEIAQNSTSFAQMDKHLSVIYSDYSLIINFANHTHVKAHEVSAFIGNKYYIPEDNSVFVSTNVYQNDTWINIPVPTDEFSWKSVSRRNNLIKSVTKDDHSVHDVMNILDKKLDNAGATWEYTIYQMVFDTHTQDLYLKVTQEDLEWTHIGLAGLFNQAECQG